MEKTKNDDNFARVGGIDMWERWVRQYREDHQHPVNKALHAVGIPAIVVALSLLFVSWK